MGRTLRACAVGDDLRPPYRASRLSEEGRRSQCSRSPAPFGPQPRRQPQAHPDRGHLFGGRGPGTRSLHAAPSSFLPDQSQSRCPVADIAQPATHRTLDRDGEHPHSRGRRRGLVRRDVVHHPGAKRLTRPGRSRGPSGPSEARRPTPNPFEHAGRAKAWASLWPRSDHEICF